jgi:radical SAM superfamily enzyme YgiQ (UPF0313 family)
VKRKLLLISPRNSSVKTTKGRQLAHLGLPAVAALTPARDWDVHIVDDLNEPIDFNADADLVGVSIFTAQATRGYEIADRFRARGTPVVIGGMHASALPDEAAAHADAVVVGEAERSWPVLVEDFERGEMKSRYHNAREWDPSEYIPPRRDLLKTRVAFGMTPVQTTRGCPYRCNFCSVHEFFGGKYLHRPVKDVIAELRAIPQKHILFIDDHIMGNVKYARELFTAMVPLKKRWGGQSTLGVARDKELLVLAQRSGCFSMFIGVESVIQETLAEANKGFNKTKDYLSLIKNYRDHGIAIVAGTIFGFDTDGPDVFEKTVAFYDMAEVAVPNYGVLCPFPGTGQFNALRAEGRLLTEDWSMYTGSHVVFKPKRLGVQELLDGKHWAARQTYSFKSIGKRFAGNWRTPLFHVATNLSYKYNVVRNFPRGHATRVSGPQLQSFLASF